MTSEEMKEVVKSVNLDRISVTLTAVMQELDEHPDIIGNVKELLALYGGLFAPTIKEAFSLSIQARQEAFLEFKRLGLSDELAVKLVVG